MLNDYLQFAKSQVQEKTTSINMVEFLNELIKDFNNNNIRFNNADTGIFIAEKTL